MTMISFQPSPGTGQSVTLGATANVTVAASDRQVVVTNTDASATGYVRIATGPCTAADFPVLPGKQVCLTKGPNLTTISVFSAGTPVFHICTGNGVLTGV
jgi:hypothetical protein